MIFVPTPKLLLKEELEPGVVLAINDDGDPIPEALTQRFSATGGIAGMVVFEGETCACWRFVNTQAESEYVTTRRLLERLIGDFEEERGEDLCSLEGEPPKAIQKDFAAYASWYIGELRRREIILEREEKIAPFRWKNYDELRRARRALYRAANRHPGVEWWVDYQELGHETQLRFEWGEESERESTFADADFAARTKASGLCVGSLVETLVVPRGARTIPIPTSTIGTISETTELYWMVSFPLPLTDCDGATWLPYDEKTTITVGYLTEELSLLPDADK